MEIGIPGCDANSLRAFSSASVARVKDFADLAHACADDSVNDRRGKRCPEGYRVRAVGGERARCGMNGGLAA
jgi:hypothetical protein